MDLKWIEDFLSLSQYGSFAQAAKARNITQPAFGRRIKLLEEWVGTDLVNRNTYPATFTKAGFRFLKHANDLKQQIDYARLETVNNFNNNETKITFHTQHSLSEYVVNKMINEYTDTFKTLLVYVSPNNLHDSVQAFIDNRSDFLIGLSFKGSRLYVPNPEVESVIIGHERLIPLVATKRDGSALYHDRKNSNVPLLSYPSNTFFAQVLEKHSSMAQSLCNFNVVYENAVTHSLKSMVLSGHGVAWLPEGFVQEELDKGLLMRFSETISPITAEIKLYRFSTEDMTLEMGKLWRHFKTINSKVKAEKESNL
ncbi:LysR family transcriptional regulator [Vibrio sp. Isolate31]|uniref:LysR family transcriptional regulator n=1 Tax=unclassified Vibrio TaxID=2614977 RepID=UPI001EFD34AC|nr:MULTISPECIES: LysR family transcriptional regulator [unclassified Vibrio]MCG9555297.1 LysR family transcriptional regulator [Vibrio sp. Isolate32]MCG9601535.1 LysR family transcriptional regulator [Vibrio sp. Isolate31]